jgi:hypothetical protein
MVNAPTPPIQAGVFDVSRGRRTRHRTAGARRAPDRQKRPVARVVLKCLPMNVLCRSVPLLLALLSLAACAEVRVTPPADAGMPPSDAAAPDGSAPDAAPPDAGLPDTGTPDAAVPDAGLLCPVLRANGVCLEDARIAAGRAFELPFQLDTCGCCPATECAVGVDAATRTLRVTTTFCADPCDCAACNPAVARCAFPALDAGTWTLEVNGEPASRLEVDDGPGVVPAPAACIDFAEDNGCDTGDPLGGAPQRATDVCVTSDRAQRHVVSLVDACGGCSLEGPCVVTVEKRFTDDLPSGNEIRVSATRYENACMPACPEVCMETTRTCILPPLVEGETQRVFVEGRPPFVFVSGREVRACSGE